MSPEAADAPPQDEHSWKPVCTTCAFPVPHLYTTYSSASNIRLAVCPRCNAFVDPLIESPPLLLALDLVLLKPQVFLHLLFNRGSPPQIAGDVAVGNGGCGGNGSGNGSGTITAQRSSGSTTSTKTASAAATTTKAAPSRSAVLTTRLTYLLASTLPADVFVRSVLSPTEALLPLTLRVCLEIGTQLGISTLLALAVLRLRSWYPACKLSSPTDGRQVGFLPVLVPLVLLYTALIPLLLHIALRVWYVPGEAHAGEHFPRSGSEADTADFGSVGSIVGESLLALSSALPFLPSAAEMALAVPAPLADLGTELYESAALAWATDPVWAGTRLLGGMSAGFGLRVLLPTRPWETTMIVICGWAAAGAVARWAEEIM